MDDIDKVIAELTAKSNTIRSESEEINKQQFTAKKILNREEEKEREMNNKLNQLENVKQQRLQILQRRDKDAYSAVMWLRENKNLFRMPIYEPIMLEVSFYTGLVCPITKKCKSASIFELLVTELKLEIEYILLFSQEIFFKKNYNII